MGATGQHDAPDGRPGRRARAAEAAAAVAQHVLLGGFTAVAAGISAQGLIGFARDNMGLRGPWPYLLFFALDGAAGMCAVLLMRRAARAETALAPRLAVWGLVAASATFNWTHAPHHPAARPAFAVMPVIAATLFEFSLHETARQGERAAGHPRRRLPGLGWLRPAELIRVQLQLAADPGITTAEAASRVRVDRAARRLHALRTALEGQDRVPRRSAAARRRARRAERRAQAALTRARFTDPLLAAQVLRQLQVRTLTSALARLDYATPQPAQAALASLITASPAAPPPARCPDTPTIPNGSRGLAHPRGRSSGTEWRESRSSWPGGNGQQPPAGALGIAGGPPAGRLPSLPDEPDELLVAAATHIVTQARRDGVTLTQTALAALLRAQGHRIANQRLRWLSAVCGLHADTPKDAG